MCVLHLADEKSQRQATLRSLDDLQQPVERVCVERIDRRSFMTIKTTHVGIVGGCDGGDFWDGHTDLQERTRDCDQQPAAPGHSDPWRAGPIPTRDGGEIKRGTTGGCT